MQIVSAINLSLNPLLSSPQIIPLPHPLLPLVYTTSVSGTCCSALLLMIAAVLFESSGFSTLLYTNWCSMGDSWFIWFSTFQGFILAILIYIFNILPRSLILSSSYLYTELTVSLSFSMHFFILPQKRGYGLNNVLD